MIESIRASRILIRLEGKTRSGRFILSICTSSTSFKILDAPAKQRTVRMVYGRSEDESPSIKNAPMRTAKRHKIIFNGRIIWMLEK
jgi:hypothetical protein